MRKFTQYFSALVRIPGEGGAPDVYEFQGRPLSAGLIAWIMRRHGDTLKGSLAFVPWTIQQSYFQGGLQDRKIICHRDSGAVVFSNASGFTALTEGLAMKSNGAEVVSQCLTDFFTPLINLIHAYRGDVIKFSGNALVIYFPAVDDSQGARRTTLPPHGSYGLPDLGPLATAVLRACACCVEIHKRLHMYDTGVDGVRLSLKIGVGCGKVAILQVGGEVPPETHVPRCEYVIAGPPMEQIFAAERLVRNGETCLSPQAWDRVKDCVIEDRSRKLEDTPEFRLLLRMDETKYTFPTIKHAAMLRDRRSTMQFQLSELGVVRRYIPSAVFKKIEGGTLTYVNELRNITSLLITGVGVDPSDDDGARITQELTVSIQRICYGYEGALNKFVIDDKGLLFLLVFGLPPLVHTDDPTRAVLACFDMVKAFIRLGIASGFGVTTGKAYCGLCGSASRREYTVLGDSVNLAARLMASAARDSILADEATKKLASVEVRFRALDPLRVKGKSLAVPIFEPSRAPPPDHVGIGPDLRIHFPWVNMPLAGMSAQGDMTVEEMFKLNTLRLCSLEDWDAINKLQSLLGGQFSPKLHMGRSPSLLPKPDLSRSELLPTVAALGAEFEGSLLLKGGVAVIEGKTGLGTIELGQHAVVHAATHLRVLPIFGSMGPRLDDPERLGLELLKSALSIYRYLDASVPSDDYQALARLLQPRHPSTRRLLAQVHEAFMGQVQWDQRQSLLDALVEVVIILVEGLRERTPLLIVMQLEIGTSLFPKTLAEFECFWSVVTTFARLAMPEADLSTPPTTASSRSTDNTHGVNEKLRAGAQAESPPTVTFAVPYDSPQDRRSGHRNIECAGPGTPMGSGVVGGATSAASRQGWLPVTLLVLAGATNRRHPVVEWAINDDHFIELEELSEESAEEYMAKCIGLPRTMVPEAIRSFVAKISSGSPLYIRETICELLSRNFIQVKLDSAGAPADVEYHQDLESINIAAWGSTAMVGETVCLLESLDPLEAAVLKISTVFSGSFTLPDVSSSICSRFAGATHLDGATHLEGATNFDNLRLLRAIQNLVELGLFARSDDDTRSNTMSNNSAGVMENFEVKSVLVRKVGGSMVLESQKRVVKRQALIDRALARDLPSRMATLRRAKNEPHIPWYYEDILSKTHS